PSPPSLHDALPICAIPYRGDQRLGKAVADPDLPPPAIDLAGANLRPPGDLRDHRSRRQARGNNRPLLLGAPPTPPFRAGDDFNPRHRTVSSTRANTIACTRAYQPDMPPLCKAAITGRLLTKCKFGSGAGPCSLCAT